jgi:hypothetical protein
MTVEELIELLKKEKPTDLVLVDDNEEFQEIVAVDLGQGSSIRLFPTHDPNELDRGMVAIRVRGY